MAQLDIAETICESVSIIVEEKIKSIQFDKTINCTIIDDSEAAVGKYKVSDGSSEFYAYSVSIDYKKNDAVYVTVPNGDFNNQKLIAGKQITNNTSPYIFRTPFDTIVDVSTNLITEKIDFNNCWLRANDPETTELLLWEKDFGESRLAGFTRLGLQGFFRSWLDSLNCVYGNYGYKLVVDCQEEVLHSDYNAYQNAIDKINEKNEINDIVLEFIHFSSGINWTNEDWENFLAEEDKLLYLENKKFYLNYNQYILYLSSQDMYGNPYNFESFYKQEKVFDISEIKAITKMSLYFYQELESFIDINNKQIPYKDEVFIDSYLSPNLFTKDAYICLGYDIDTFDNDEVTLYTLDSLTYVDKNSVTSNTKHIILRWVHQFDERIKIVSKDADLDYEIRWYQYVLGSPSADEYSGVYWRRIDNNEFYYNLEPSLNSEIEQIKVIILYKDKPIRSNILTFTNQSEVMNEATMEALVGLNIWCNDKTYGNYFIYDPGNKILEQYSVKEAKRMSALFSISSGLSKNETSGSLLTEATSITWSFPAVNSMIAAEGINYSTPYPSADNSQFTICAPRDMTASQATIGYVDGTTQIKTFTFKLNDGSQVVYDHIDKVIEITRYGNPNSGWSIDATQLYLLKENYSQEYSNNVIQCSIIKDNKKFFTAKEFYFGQAGTTGTDTTLRIYIDPSNEFALDITQPTLNIKAMLFNSQNKEVDLKNTANDKVKFEWSWFCYSLGGITQPNVEIVPTILSNTTSQDDANFIIQNKILNEKSELINSPIYYKSANRNAITIQQKPNSAALNMNEFLILQCTVRGWGDYPLIAYKPIALRNGNKYSYVDCANEVIYLTAGYPNYYKDAWQIHLTKSDVDDDGYEDLVESTWEIFNPFNENTKYIGSFKNNVLQPLGIYMSNIKQYGAQCKVDGTTVWTQPIVCLQNNYPSSTLNQWSGKEIDINYDNGYILSPAIAAGKKVGNAFSGVMLGDWNTGTADDISKQTGLYGFHEGAMSFAFKEDGTAFIGKSGKGRILLDGNESTIKSAGYNLGHGVLIDLDDNIFEMTNGQGGILLEANGDLKVDFSDSSGTSLFYIDTGSDDYFLRSSDYSSSNETGVMIDLENGHIDAYDFKIEASGTGGTLTLDSSNDTHPFNVNDKFKIGWDGNITATWGTIGGFTITDHSIFGGKTVSTYEDAKAATVFDTPTFWGKQSEGKYDFRLGNSLIYASDHGSYGKLYLNANIYSVRRVLDAANGLLTEEQLKGQGEGQEASGYMIFGINNISTQKISRLQIGSASGNAAGYDGISMYGNGGAIYLVSTGTTVDACNAEFGLKQIRFVGRGTETKLIVQDIPADRQEGIYARFA